MTRDAELQRDLSEIKTEGLKHFAASRGWVEKFVKRRALCSVSLAGEGASANATKMTEVMKKLRNQLSEYESDCIFNVDETVLFCFLVHTFAPLKTKRPFMILKQCVGSIESLIVYVQIISGTKVPMCVIGTGKKSSVLSHCTCSI